MAFLKDSPQCLVTCVSTSLNLERAETAWKLWQCLGDPLLHKQLWHECLHPVGSFRSWRFTDAGASESTTVIRSDRVRRWYVGEFYEWIHNKRTVKSCLLWFQVSFSFFQTRFFNSLETNCEISWDPVCFLHWWLVIALKVPTDVVCYGQQPPLLCFLKICCGGSVVDGRHAKYTDGSPCVKKKKSNRDELQMGGVQKCLRREVFK